MSRMATEIELSPEETDELNRWIKSGKTEQRKVERAKIVLRSAEGKPTHQIAKELGTRPTRVSKWLNRFAQLRVPGLEDEPRSGRRVINDESVEHRILDQLAKALPPRIRVLEWHDLAFGSAPELVCEYRSRSFPGRRAKL